MGLMQKLNKLKHNMPGIKRDPVLVYQMGKVASSTIYYSLSDSNKYRTYHIHRLNPENIAKTRQDHTAKGYKPLVENKGLQLYENIFEKRLPAFIISLVREPISRNISAYFQNLDHFQGRENAHENFLVDDMIDDFLSSYSHNVPLEWFDIEMKPVTGIDVFDYKFNCVDGYLEIKEEPYKLLVMRHDLDDSKKADVVKEFLGLDKFDLTMNNIGSTKVYSDVYKNFLSKIQLPAEYVDRMLDAKYTKHFYCADEIESIRTKWTKD
jgi:hypothetical protein